MNALILRLVLVATLALNGIGAPMAMGHEMGASPQAAAATDDHDAHAAHHRGESSLPENGPGPSGPTAGGCCDDALCTCGCILPPALVFAFAIQFPHVHAPLPQATDASATPLVAMSAPFRPPAA